MVKITKWIISSEHVCSSYTHISNYQWQIYSDGFSVPARTGRQKLSVKKESWSNETAENLWELHREQQPHIDTEDPTWATLLIIFTIQHHVHDILMKLLVEWNCCISLSVPGRVTGQKVYRKREDTELLMWDSSTKNIYHSPMRTLAKFSSCRNWLWWNNDGMYRQWIIKMCSLMWGHGGLQNMYVVACVSWRMLV